MIIVVNRHRYNGPYQYAGRGTPLGNPFPQQKGATRKLVIDSFREWAIAELANNRDGEFATEMRNLKVRHDAGDTVILACSCKPKPCHLDIVVELIEEGYVSGSQPT